MIIKGSRHSGFHSLKGVFEMSDDNNCNFVYSMIVMIIVLGLSYSLDLFYFFLSNRAKVTFTFMPVVLVAAVFPFGIAALIALITWYAFTRTYPRSRAQLIYLLVGLLFQIFLISSVYSFPIFLRGTFIDSFRQVVFSHGLLSNFSILSALLVILGVIGLVRSPQNKVVDNQTS